jgi:hypothetical protein
MTTNETFKIEDLLNKEATTIFDLTVKYSVDIN